MDRKSFRCFSCGDKGYIQFIPLDGSTIYSWMKYEKKACKCEAGRKWSGDKS